jgi:hypothetical protein
MLGFRSFISISFGCKLRCLGLLIGGRDVLICVVLVLAMYVDLGRYIVCFRALGRS